MHNVIVVYCIPSEYLGVSVLVSRANKNKSLILLSEYQRSSLLSIE